MTEHNDHIESTTGDVIPNSHRMNHSAKHMEWALLEQRARARADVTDGGADAPVFVAPDPEQT